MFILKKSIRVHFNRSEIFLLFFIQYNISKQEARLILQFFISNSVNQERKGWSKTRPYINVKGHT